MEYGIKIVFQHIRTWQEAIDEFIAKVKNLGCIVTPKPNVGSDGDMLVITGVTSNNIAEINKLTRALDEELVALRRQSAPTYASVNQFQHWFGDIQKAQKADADAKAKKIFDSIFKDQEVLKASLKPKAKPKPKLVHEIAPKALSTWNFESTYLPRLSGHTVRLVGQNYRMNEDREVLSWKKVGNMVLLVAEPDNGFDINAVMMLAWNDQTKNWHHVGYVRREEAAILRGRWTGDFKNVMVGRFSSIPKGATGHRTDPNISVVLTGECRKYPDYISAMRSAG